MQSKYWTIVTAFIDLVIGTGMGFVLNEILTNYASEKWTLGILLLIVAFSLYALNTWLFSKIYDKCWFLRRFFASKKYIEGTWVQIIDDESLVNIPPTKYTIIIIKIENGIPMINVNTYNQSEGSEMVCIRIPNSKFDEENSKLEYHYKFRSREFPIIKHWIGYAELEFSQTQQKTYFNKYSGVIISNLPRDNEIRVRAFKHTKKIKLSNGKKVRIDETTIKQKEVRTHIDNHIKTIF